MKMAFPFKRILAPVDFDESSLSALDLAAKLARQNDAMVSVLHIVPVDIDLRGMPQYTELIQRQESIDHDKLSAVAKQHLADVKWEVLDQMGPPADVIAEVAVKIGADIIVMVTHGRRGLARLVEGSVAEKVLRIAPCPVLAVRRDS
jgi:nucleotide-binding universal stress UspA family protein